MFSNSSIFSVGRKFSWETAKNEKCLTFQNLLARMSKFSLFINSTQCLKFSDEKPSFLPWLSWVLSWRQIKICMPYISLAHAWTLTKKNK